MQQDAISAFRKNLNDLEETIVQAKRVPLSNMIMVDRDRTLSIMDAVIGDLPTVIAECEGVVQNQISIISEANERAEQTKQNATMRANQYVSDARNQAQQMVPAAFFQFKLSQQKITDRIVNPVPVVLQGRFQDVMPSGLQLLDVVGRLVHGDLAALAQAPVLPAKIADCHIHIVIKRLVRHQTDFFYIAHLESPPCIIFSILSSICNIHKNRAAA